LGEIRRDGIAEIIDIWATSSRAVVHFINKSIIAINIPFIDYNQPEIDQPFFIIV
jgi:hypothetical protein